MNRSGFFVLVLGSVSLLGRAALGVTVPFTENFSNGNADWRQASTASVVNVLTSGGPNGDNDAYATYDRTFSTSQNAAIVFRGVPTSSNGAFAGDWISAGVRNASYWVRQNGPENLIFGLRVSSSSNGTAINILPTSNLVAPNVWTLLSFDISLSNPDLVEEGDTFANVLSDAANFQVEVKRTSSNTLANAITLDLDKPNISVPEPGSVGLAAVSGAAFLLRRRRAS